MLVSYNRIRFGFDLLKTSNRRPDVYVRYFLPVVDTTGERTSLRVVLMIINN